MPRPVNGRGHTLQVSAQEACPAAGEHSWKGTPHDFRISERQRRPSGCRSKHHPRRAVLPRRHRKQRQLLERGGLSILSLALVWEGRNDGFRIDYRSSKSCSLASWRGNAPSRWRRAEWCALCHPQSRTDRKGESQIFPPAFMQQCLAGAFHHCGIVYGADGMRCGRRAPRAPKDCDTGDG